MSCCGQKRQQWQQETARPQPVPTIPEAVLEKPVSIQYHGDHSYLVRGPQTGFLYLFPAKGNNLIVDGRDAAIFIADAQKFSTA